jgi:hypothetical protein
MSSAICLCWKEAVAANQHQNAIYKLVQLEEQNYIPRYLTGKTIFNAGITFYMLSTNVLPVLKKNKLHNVKFEIAIVQVLQKLTASMPHIFFHSKRVNNLKWPSTQNFIYCLFYSFISRATQRKFKKPTTFKHPTALA